MPKRRTTEEARIYMRKWRQKNLESRRTYERQYMQIWRAKQHPEYNNEIAARSTYHLTVEQYDAMRERHVNGPCDICGTNESGGSSKKFHLDHDHVTQAMRGILCARCNHMLGHAKDRPEVLRMAADYLERTDNEEPIATLANLASAYRDVLGRASA